MNSMGSDKFRKAIGKVKDHTSISLARVSSSTTLPDLEVAIVKATRHEEYPAEERRIREIINLTTDSPTYVAECISLISARLDKTRNWIVALKILIVLQRLLQDGDPAFEQEIFFATRRGTRLLNMSDFRDMSRSNSWDFSAFVRTYSLYLDEYLEYRMQGRREKHGSYFHEEDEEEPETKPIALVLKSPVPEKSNDNLFSRLQHLMQLLERFLACRPAGPATNHRIVMVALYPILKQSFDMYGDITDVLSIFIDRFTELEISDSIKVYEILRRVGKQYDELEVFYDYCKSIGLARTSEYPDVEKISQKKLETMDKFIREKSVKTDQYRTEELEADNEEGKWGSPKMNTIKASPGPEGFREDGKKELKKSQDDLLNLGDGGQTVEEYADKVGLAFFDGGPTNQQPSLPGGLSTVVVDETYQQGRQNSGNVATGSARSSAGGDTFSDSLSTPAYVPMAEMEKKQESLVDDQKMWHQYQRDGLQEQVGVVGNVPSNTQPK
ncbi:hypothetical protein L2E82_24844 [Cichorium intybus]|uniref:Uncharacterized protein n=1 Tax=Cichorium intybus TaxID=13427 RepID=A0ACB9E1W4_CICIN|nr:hypothetical protein L2E82_24844 [Cichorium intybus]